MNDLYWITRIGALSEICSVASTVGIVIILVLLLFGPLMYMEFGGKSLNVIKKIAKYSLITWIIAIIGCILVPSKKEMFLIYGLGGTIDYIQDNETAKKLPDKAVKALDKYLESLSEEDEK